MKPTKKKLSLKSFSEREEKLKLAQLTEVYAQGGLEPDLEEHLRKRIKELSIKLFP